MRKPRNYRDLGIGAALGVALTVAVGFGMTSLKGQSDSHNAEMFIPDNHHDNAEVVIPNYHPEAGPLQLISLEDYDSIHQGPMRFRDETSNCLFIGEMARSISDDSQAINIARVTCPPVNGVSLQGSVALAIPLKSSAPPIRANDKLNAYLLINTGLGAQMIHPMYFAGKAVEAIDKCKKSDGAPCMSPELNQ